MRSAFVPRLVASLLLGSAVLTPGLYQPVLDRLYDSLRQASFYKASTFETAWTVVIYAIVEVLYTYRYAHNPSQRLAVKKTDDITKPIPKLQRPSKRIGEGITYILPLLTLDLTMIKKFHGVPVYDMALSGNYDPGTVAMRGHFLSPTLHRFTWQSPLQTQRALPATPPSSRQLVLQLIASIIIYDAVFFLFHLALHHLPVLHKIHKTHHAHEEINPQVTNQLDVIERLGLVLLANFSLNIIGAHVFTRTCFVPMFVWLLVDIHSGMDQEWGYDEILPAGWAAGSKRHGIHHQYGHKYYAPFFNWCDDGYEWMRGRWATRRSRRRDDVAVS